MMKTNVMMVVIKVMTMMKNLEKVREAEAAREDAARLELILMEQREASQPPVDAFLVEVDEDVDEDGDEDEDDDYDYDERSLGSS